MILELMSKIDIDKRIGFRQPQPDERIVQGKRLQSLLGIVVVGGRFVFVNKIQARSDHGHASHLAFAKYAALLEIKQGFLNGEIGENAGVERKPSIAEQRRAVQERRRVGCGSEGLGIRGALRQDLPLLNHTLEILEDEYTRLAGTIGSFRVESLASQKLLEKNETLVVACDCADPQPNRPRGLARLRPWTLSAMPSPCMLIRGCLVNEVPYNRRFTMESRSPCRRRARMLESCRRAHAIHWACVYVFQLGWQLLAILARMGLTLA